MASEMKELKAKAEHWMGMDHGEKKAFEAKRRKSSRRYMLLDKTLRGSTMHGGAKAVA